MPRRPYRTTNATTTLTSKHQLTVPAAVCCAKGFTPGDRFTISPRGREEFVAVLKRPSRILDFAGDLKRPRSRSEGGAAPLKTNPAYVTTNIRLSEALYLELKVEAARRRLSLGALIRERIQAKLAGEGTDQ